MRTFLDVPSVRSKTETALKINEIHFLSPLPRPSYGRNEALCPIQFSFDFFLSLFLQIFPARKIPIWNCRGNGTFPPRKIPKKRRSTLDSGNVQHCVRATSDRTSPMLQFAGWRSECWIPSNPQKIYRQSFVHDLPRKHLGDRKDTSSLLWLARRKL